MIYNVRSDFSYHLECLIYWFSWYWVSHTLCRDLISLDRLSISELFLIGAWRRDQTLTTSLACYEHQILNINITHLQSDTYDLIWYCWLEHVVCDNECQTLMFYSHILNIRHYKYPWMIILSDNMVILIISDQ